MERAGAKTGSAKAGQFILSQTFSIGSLKIRYYGLTMALAVVLGYFIGWWRAKKAGLSQHLYDDFAFWLVIISFISARVYYVLFYPQYFRGNAAEIFKIWHGGLAIYGALIGGFLTTLVFAKKNNLRPLALTDILAFALPLSQALGRIGNLLNYEAFGTPTSLPWKMYVPPQFRPPGYANFSYFHPTFAYEAIWDIIVFLILIFAAKKQPRTGVLSAIYLIAYSIGRFFIEGIRLDSAFFGPFRGDQLTAVAMVIIGLIILYREKHAAQA